MNAASVAVVGAGLAGLACARVLHEAGVPVRVFESQRAPGGRLATRRFAAASFDHGAQYLTAGDPGFRSLLERAAAAGCAATWQPKWPQRNGGEALWVGSPGMAALARHFAHDLDVEYGTRIVRLVDGRRGWALLDRFSEHVGRTLPRALVADAYRWRHARVEEPLGEACLLDRDAGIGFCGDWCLAARAEAAWRSGAALGAELVQAHGVVASGKIRGSR